MDSTCVTMQLVAAGEILLAERARAPGAAHTAGKAEGRVHATRGRDLCQRPEVARAAVLACAQDDLHLVRLYDAVTVLSRETC